MTSKEALELLELILNNHSVMLEVDDNRMECLNTIKQNLERLEVLEKLVYTNQFENTKNIENEFGRAFTILQNHCVAMEDTLYASRVLIQLISKYEKLKKAFKLACKKLDWDCPCGQDLIDDLDCENRCQPDIDYSECWVKYFIKEVLE